MINEKEQNIINDYVETRSNKAATEFIRMYQKFVFSVALRYLNSYDDSEDITQEVFIKALDVLHTFNGRSSVKTWLYRITVNKCLNFKRKQSFLSIFSRNDDASLDDFDGKYSSPEQTLIGKDLEKLFLDELAKLPEKQRETFALRYFENMTYEEISNILGTSIGGLKANFHQAIKKLSKKLKSE